MTIFVTIIITYYIGLDSLLRLLKLKLDLTLSFTNADGNF